MMHVELIHHHFPDAPEEHDRDLWVVDIVVDDHRTLAGFHLDNHLYNYHPLTYADMVERAARQHAEGCAKKFGIPLIDRTGKRL